MKKQNEKIIETLNEIGLTHNESNVYLSMLSLGPASVLKISRAAGVNRTTIYNVIEKLKEKGLVRIDPGSFKKIYIAEDPSNLQSVLDKKKESYANILPTLETLYNLRGGDINIKYYDTPKSIENAYFDFLKTLEWEDDYLVIGDPDLWEVTNKFSNGFIKKRNKTKLNVKMILTNTFKSKEYKNFEKNFEEEIRFLPDSVKIESQIVLGPKQLVIQQMAKPSHVIVIESSSIIKLHKELFNILWATLGK